MEKSLGKKIIAVSLAMAAAFNNAAEARPGDSFRTLLGQDINSSSYSYGNIPGLFFHVDNHERHEEIIDSYHRFDVQMQDPAKRKVVVRFLQFLERYRGLPRNELFSAIDKMVDNYMTYTREIDMVAPTKNYWSTPYETIVDPRGDCEDFATLKYFSLVHLGVPASTLRLAYMYTDMGSSEGYWHVNLLAEGDDGRKYFMDEYGDSRLQPEESYHAKVFGLFNFTASGMAMLSEKLEQLQDSQEQANNVQTAAGVKIGR